MAGCEDFEIAIGMARHGALGEPERTALERHLQGCASCRGFEEASRRTEGAMAELTGEVMGQVDWSRVERKLRRRQAEVQVRMAVGGLVSLVVMGGLALFAPPPDRLEVLTAMTLVVAFIWFTATALVAFRSWRVARLASTGELLAAERRQLTRRLAIATRARWFVLFLVGLQLVRALDAPDARHAWMSVYVGAVLAAIFVFLTWVRLPQARRELADLGAPEPGGPERRR